MASFITAQQREALIELYIGYFNRAPEAAGLNYWAGELLAALNAGQTEQQALAGIANRFYDAGVQFGVYSNAMTVEQFITTVYRNVLGRDEVDSPGMTYWTRKLTSGEVSRGQFVREIIQAAKDYVAAAPANDPYKWVGTYLANRKAVGEWFAANSTGLTGQAAIDQGTAIIANSVTRDSAQRGQTREEAVAAAQASQVAQQGQTFTLTTSADAFTGTAGNDTFVGVIGSNGLTANGTTFSPGDNLNGGAGTDTLNISISGTHGADQTHSSFTLTNIEKVLVTNFETNDAALDTIDMGGATGVTTVGLANSSATGDVAFTNLANVVDAEMRGGGDLSVIYASGLLTGPDDAVKLTLNGVGTSAAPAKFKTWNGAATGVAETLNIVSQTAANFITIDGVNDHKTINVSGDKALTISGQLDTTVTTVDASAATAGVTIQTHADLPATFKFIGGAGNDTVRLTEAADVAATHTIAGGGGTDTLQIVSASNASQLTTAGGQAITGFEIVEGYRDDQVANGASNEDVAVDVSLLSGVTQVGVSTWRFEDNANDSVNSTANDSVTFTKLEAGTKLALSGIAAIGLDSNDQANLTLNVSASPKTNTTSDAIEVTLGTATAAATSSTQGTVQLKLTLGDYETITLVSQGGNNTLNTLDSASLKTLNINATKAITIEGGTNGNLKTINASGSTANVILYDANDTLASNFSDNGSETDSLGLGSSVTITGGAGNDRFKGSSAADSLVGGAGNDKIVGAGGNDTIDGGDGHDTLIGGAGSDSILGGAGNDIINMMSGNDYVDGGAGNDIFLVSGTPGNNLSLNQNDTLVGGEGIDTIRFTDDGNFSLNDSAIFTNVSGVEKFEFKGLSGNNDTVTVSDVVIGAAGGTVWLVNASNSTTTWDASHVLSNTSKVVYEQSSTVSADQTYKLGNGIDDVTLGSGNDTVEVGNLAYWTGTDTLRAGAGNGDKLKIAMDITSAVTISAAQLASLSGFEELHIDDSNHTSLGSVTVTLTDTFLANNNNTSNSSFTVSVDANDTSAVKIDGSGVGSVYRLILSGAGGNDTLLGGAGNDEITVKAGKNTVNAGAGSDTVRVQAAQNVGSSILGGDGTDLLVVGDTNDSASVSINLATSTVSGFERIAVDGKDTATFAGSVLSGSSIEIYGDSGNTSETIIVEAVGGGTTDLSGLKFDGSAPSGFAAWNDSANADKILINGSALNDVIVGSKRADTITGGAGNDTIDLTAGGNDTVKFEASASLNGVDTILGFATGGDKLDFSAFIGTNGTMAPDADLSNGFAVNSEAGVVLVIDSALYSAALDGSLGGLSSYFQTGTGTASGKLSIHENDASDFVLLVADSTNANQVKVYYVDLDSSTGAFSATDTIKLVGTITLTAVDNITDGASLSNGVLTL